MQVKLKARLIGMIEAAVCDGQREIVIVVDRQQIAVIWVYIIHKKRYLEQGMQSL